MNKRLVCTAHNVIGWQESDLPDLQPHDLRVRNTHGAEKHGTMAAMIHGYASKRGKWDPSKQMFVESNPELAYPFNLGNMQVGIVEEIGSQVENHAPGDRILYFGGFASVAVVSERDSWRLRPDTSWKAATCLDPTTYALCALRDAHIRLGDAVAIFSLGAIGLMAVQLAKLAGCHPIIAIDPLLNRREVALKTGATHVINPVGTDVGAELRELTHWRGVDAVIEYSGAMEAIQAALRGVALGGNVVLGGFPGPMKAGLDLGAEAHLNRPNIIFSRSETDPGRDHPRWDHARVRATALRLIMAGRIDGEPIVTPVMKFTENMPADYQLVTSSPNTGIKLGVEY